MSGMTPRGRFITKVVVGAAASLTGLAVLFSGDMRVDPSPAIAADVDDKKNSALSYVKFDVQVSDSQQGSFIVEVHPGESIFQPNRYGFLGAVVTPSLRALAIPSTIVRTMVVM